MISWVLLLISLAWLAVFRYRRRRMYQLSAPIPSTRLALPIVGTSYTMMGNSEKIMKNLQEISIETREHDGMVKMWLGPILYFTQANPVDVEMLLKTALEKDDLHRFVREIIGNGGIFAPVPIWRRRRKVLVPAFTPKLLDNFVNVFYENSCKLTKNLGKQMAEGRFKVWPRLFTTSLDSICQNAMGLNINAQDDLDSPFFKALTTVQGIITLRLFYLWLQPQWMFKLSSYYKPFETSKEILFNFTDGVIHNKREEMKKQESSNGCNKDTHGLEAYKKYSFLDLLIRLSGRDEGFTNLELREEVITMTVAGSDTSAVAVGNTLKLLGKYPHIQDKVYEELHDVFGDTGRPFDKDDLKSLVYLDRVVKESLRLFPPVPFIARKIEEDTLLPSGRTLPPGAGVVISIWGLHRDPKYWGPTADHFDPDRFLPERFQLDHPCSFMPFSQGPRNCVGYQYAIMSVKTQLATILRHYKVIDEVEQGPIPHMDMKYDLMMKAVDGYEMAFEKRSPTVSISTQL